MKKKNRVAVLIYLISLIFLAVIIYVIPSVTGMLQSTDVLEYGNLTESDRQTKKRSADRFFY